MKRQPELEDHYAVLGLSRSATPDEIKAAYRARAKSLHPDLNPDADTTAEFQRVQKAYTVLTNARARHRYDDRTAAPPAPKPVRRPRATRTVTRPSRAYALAAAVLLAAAGATVWVLTHSPSPVAPETAFEHAMEIDVARQAQDLYAGPREPATMEVTGRDGRKHMLPREQYRKIEPLHDRLTAERATLERRRADLGRRKEALEALRRAVEQAKGTGAFEFQLKAEAYNRDAQAFVRDAEHHTRDVNHYFTELDRLVKEQE